MDYTEIKILLDKFWKGATNLSEEAELKSFFRDHPVVPPELEQHQAYFARINAHEKLRPDEDLTQTIDFGQPAPGELIFFPGRLLKYAAALVPAICLGLFLLSKKPDGELSAQGAVTNPQKAMTTIEQELLALSSNLNEVTSQIEGITGETRLNREKNKHQ